MVMNNIWKEGSRVLFEGLFRKTGGRFTEEKYENRQAG
jgi:hypothetical protein